jgi:hypothetical protein
MAGCTDMGSRWIERGCTHGTYVLYDLEVWKAKIYSNIDLSMKFLLGMSD